MPVPIPIDRVVIEIVDHSEQRYNTVGDWTLQGGLLTIRASRMPDDLHWPIVDHEMAEARWCARNGVSQGQVDEFDAKFELTAHGNLEPGDDHRAPYYEGHQIGIIVEKMAVLEMGWSWAEYLDVIDEPYLKRRATERRRKKKETTKP